MTISNSAIRLGENVFDVALGRILELYEAGHRITCSISGGKDSTCCLELCILAARMTDRLPVEVIMREEEVIYPGVSDYLRRTYEREEVDMHWYLARNPSLNCFNREEPYWWVCDPLLDPEEWVEIPPDYAEDISLEAPNTAMSAMSTKERFPPDPGKNLVDIIGLRSQESNFRFLSVISAGGHMTQERSSGAMGSRPIYDWRDGDVWKAIKENGWDYCSAYDVMHRMGVPARRLRIGPPTLNVASIEGLRVASQAWPQWFDRVIRRLPGVRTAVQYGRRTLEPERRFGETWEETFKRECILKAPEWIKKRSIVAMEQTVGRHEGHSTAPFPDSQGCPECTIARGSWRALANIMYLGDPFCQKMGNVLPLVDPETFRPGSGYWNVGKGGEKPFL